MSLFQKTVPISRRERLFSGKALFKIIFPMLLQQILNMTVGMVNSIMVSHAGEAAVSAVSLVNTLDTMLVVFFTALVSGGSVVIAQVLGTNEWQDVNNVAKQLLYAATIVATVLTTVVLTFKGPLLSVLFGDVEADVMSNAHEYFFVVALSFPLLAINEAAGACFRASGNSFISLMTSIAINIMNILGNAVFVIGLDMGAKGSGMATVCARLGGAVILLILIHMKKYPVHIERLLHYKPNLKIVKNILNIGIPNGIENTLFQFGRLMTQTLVAMLGTSVIAANAVALNLANYQYAVNTAFSVVMIPIVGRCIGAKNVNQAKYYSRLLLKLEYAMLMIVIVITLAFLGPLMSTYNLSEEGTALTIKLIIFHSIVAALIYPLGFLLPSTFRAASDVRFTLVVSMISMWVLRVAVAYVLALETVSVFGLFSFSGLGLGIWGVWIAMIGDWILRSAVYAVRYFSGRWLKVKGLI